MEGFMLTFTSAIVFFSKGQCKCDWCCEVLIEDIEVMGQSWGASECWPIAALPQRRPANGEGDVRHLRRRGWCDADGDNRILIESSVMRQPRPELWSHTACYWTLQWTISKVTLAGKHQYINYATHLNYLAKFSIMRCDVVLLTDWKMYWSLHETCQMSLRWPVVTREGWEVGQGGGGGNQLHPIIGGWAVSGVPALPSPS